MAEGNSVANFWGLAGVVDASSYGMRVTISFCGSEVGVGKGLIRD